MQTPKIVVLIVVMHWPILLQQMKKSRRISRCKKNTQRRFNPDADWQFFAFAADVHARACHPNGL